MNSKRAQTRVPVSELVAERWSPRSFDPDRPVEPEKLLALVEAARWAPSCFGDEPWRFVVFDREADPAGFQRAFDALSEGNQAWVRHAPLLLLVAADTQFSRNGKPNRWAAYDTGAAAENLCLEAVHQGLVAHQMGGFDEERARQAAGVPERFVPMAMIAVGYLGAAERLEGRLRETELGPRRRRPLAETVFAGAWGRALEVDPNRR